MNRIRRDVMFYMLGSMAVLAGVRYGLIAGLAVGGLAMMISMWNA